MSRNKRVVDNLASEPKVACDTLELKELIRKWTENENWKFEDFITFIELVGIKTPIKLSHLDKENHSFQCITALNTKVTISLRFSNFFTSSSEILVTEGTEIRRYTINSNDLKENTVPSVTFFERRIIQNGKKLYCSYSQYCCHRRLTFDGTHYLDVKINKPFTGAYDDSNTVVLRNCQQIEEYLLGLDTPLVVSEVYSKVVKLLEFSNKDISNCPHLSFSCIETVGKEKKEEKIAIIKGKMLKSIVIENQWPL